MEEEEEEKKGDDIPSWIVGFADLMTLLFATFVVLYGLKPEGKTKAFQGTKSTIRESFIEIPDDIPVEIKVGKVILGKSTFKKRKGTSLQPKLIINKDDTDYPIEVVDKDISSVINKINMLSEEKKLLSDDKKLMEAFSYSVSEKQLSLNFLTSAFYELGSDKLSKKGLKMVDQILATLADLDRPIHFEGHASLKTNSRRISNWELSSRRASQLAYYFITTYDYPKHKITSVGMGSEKPLHSHRENIDVDYRNDRVEVKVNFK